MIFSKIFILLTLLTSVVCSASEIDNEIISDKAVLHYLSSIRLLSSSDRMEPNNPFIVKIYGLDEEAVCQERSCYKHYWLIVVSEIGKSPEIKGIKIENKNNEDVDVFFKDYIAMGKNCQPIVFKSIKTGKEILSICVNPWSTK